MTSIALTRARFIAGLLFALTLGLSAAAWALPQFAVRSASRCDTCHVEPTDWENPELADRKCTLNCNGCHVSPTGGGMRNHAGRFYQTHALPMFYASSAEAYRPIELASTQPTTQPASAPSTQPTTQPSTTHPVPPPFSAARYAGIEPHPTFQIGADGRFMLYWPFDDSQEFAAFPMQLDAYLAWRPYNPRALNEGRLTVYLNPGMRGSRSEKFNGAHERLFVREYWVMYDDLPYNLYARAGRMLPPHGWRLDDHTSFVRQSQNILGLPNDFERQVTGVEVGINPNYFYAHLNVFNAANNWKRPINADDGFGTALSAGWRDLAWHAGVSTIYGSQDDVDQVAYSLQWGLNFEVMHPDVPLIYLGEFHFNHRLPESDRSSLGLAAFHELGWWIRQGLNYEVRYDWRDPDTELKHDTAHRLTTGFRWYPVPYAELILHYRHNWRHTDERFDFASDEVFLQLHGSY